MTDEPDIPPVQRPAQDQPPMQALPAPMPVGGMPRAPSLPPDRDRAMTSLLLGIFSFIPGLGVVLGLLAIALGGLALHRKMPGRKMAVAGLTLGILGILMTGFVLLGLVYSGEFGGGSRASRQQCRSNLAAIGSAITQYEMDHSAYPPDFPTLNKAGYIGGTATLQCPAHSQPGSTQWDYFYAPPAANAPSQTLMVCDLRRNHKDEGGRNVYRADDYYSEWLSEKEFQTELARPENAAFAKALRAIEGP